VPPQAGQRASVETPLDFFITDRLFADYSGQFNCTATAADSFAL
jgi:hypothetical protein